MNVTEFLFRHAAAWPERPALIVDGGVISYGRMAAGVELVRARLLEAGIRKGDRVAVALRAPQAYLTAVLALARMGAVATAYNHDAPSEMREQLLLRHQASAIVQRAGQTWRSARIEEARHFDIERLLEQPHPGQRLALAPPADDVDQALWLISFSSGTTGIPKSIPHTHARALMNIVLGQGTAHAHLDAARLLVFMDASASVATYHILRAWMGGGTVCWAAGAAAENFFECVARDRPNQVLTTTALAGKIVEGARSLPDSRALCASVQNLTVTGSVVSPALREGLLAHVCPHLEINYGASEAGVIALADRDTLAARPESAGRLVPWVHGEAIDEDGRRLRAGERGVLRFRSPTLVGGYMGDEAATTKSFREGWFYPGDIGSIDAGGYLVLAGRTDDRLNLGGRKIDPGVIEQALNDHAAVAESAAAAVALGEVGRMTLVAVVVRRPGTQVEAAELIEWCAARVGRSLAPAIVAFTDALPRNENGKIRRGLLARSVRVVGKKSGEAT